MKSEWACMLSYEVIMNLFLLSCHLKFKRTSSNQRRIISLRRAHKHFGIPLWNFEKLQLFSFQIKIAVGKKESKFCYNSITKIATVVEACIAAVGFLDQYFVKVGPWLFGAPEYCITETSLPPQNAKKKLKSYLFFRRNGS